MNMNMQELHETFEAIAQDAHKLVVLLNENGMKATPTLATAMLSLAIDTLADRGLSPAHIADAAAFFIKARMQSPSPMSLQGRMSNITH